MNRQEYLLDVIKSVIVSEKSQKVQKDNNTFAFKVLRSATKNDIKAAVETIFEVSVVSVNTLNMEGKAKRTRHGLGRCQDWKKAYVTLAPGQSLEEKLEASETAAE